MANFQYDFSKKNEFPAPIIPRVIIRKSHDSEKRFECDCKLDTGANISCFPSKSLIEIGLRDFNNESFSDINGNEIELPVAHVLIKLPDKPEVGPRKIAGINQKKGVIGRDLLNCMEIYLDGPNTTIIY